MVLGVCVSLVLVTIGFEKLKHHVEHELPHHMLPVISALFGELTVLGFIALYTYFMLQTGVLPEISTWVYHDETELVEQFESVHFTLFFVMVTFLVQAWFLLGAAMRTEQRYGEVEEFIAKDGHSFTAQKCVDAMLVAKRNMESSRFGPLDFVARNELSRTRFALTYALLRQRFILHPRLPNEELLPRNFNFGAYLRTLISETVSHLLHVTELTWVFVVLTIFIALELPVACKQFGAAVVHRIFHVHVTMPEFTHVGWLVGFSALLCLGIAVLDAKLAHILYMITPPHPLLSPKAAVQAADAYRAKRGHRSSSIALAEPLLLPISLQAANGHPGEGWKASPDPEGGWVRRHSEVSPASQPTSPPTTPHKPALESRASATKYRKQSVAEEMEEAKLHLAVPPAFHGGTGLDAKACSVCQRRSPVVGSCWPPALRPPGHAA